MTAYPRGSEWRMWDLHVHSPDSIVQDYKGSEADRWPRFIDELEALPQDMKVLGINDYWFLDGYKKVRAAKKDGRLANIDEIFPVIEFRCDTFSGSEGGLKRINLHLVLDPSEPVDDLIQQLGSVMRCRYQLTPDLEPVDWNEVPTRSSMDRLGQRIIESTPEDKKGDFAHKSPLEVGFNNLNVNFESLRKGIADNSYLREHVMLALGKVEWDTIKWSAGSIAQKKTIINSVQAVFTAAKTRDAFGKSLGSLRAASVRHHLLDCSDAHTWAESDSHMRLGNCFTWINADPTFKGLRQALQEYDHRVTTAERPDVLTRVAHSPRSVITQVRLRPVDEQSETRLFDSDLDLNPGFVVVIGNKGQGKSALLDSIALASNSDRHEDFSFLNSKRFRSQRSVAGAYRSGVRWADTSTTSAGLNDDHAPASAIRVDYLPQSLIEKVCSADPNSATKQDFEGEIERVVFRHIEDADRGSATSLRQLLQEKGTAFRTALAEGRARITRSAETLSTLRHRRVELELLDLPKRRGDLEAQLAEVAAALAEVTAEIESGGSAEQQQQAGDLRAARESRQAVVDAMQDLERRSDEIRIAIAEVSEIHDRLRTAVADARAAADDGGARIGVASESLLEVSYEDSALTAWIAARAGEIEGLERIRTESGGMDDQLAVASKGVAEKQLALQSLNDEAQALLTRQSDLRAQHEGLTGEPGDSETIRGVSALEVELASVPDEIAAATKELRAAFEQVHKALSSVMALQRVAYQPATEFVEGNDLAKEARLAFDVEFRVRDFSNRWAAMVNRQRLGQLPDMTAHDRDSLLLGDLSLNNPDELWDALTALVDRLGREGGRPDGASRSLESIMRSGHTPADLLGAVYDLEWLQSQYIIRSDGAELSELSPGQRGLVLLLFYLLVDKSERPLLLDQPEENLDNQTVRNVLVPALQEAVRRRQIIAVTHNPNFAVVGDADQIVVATFDGQFRYRSGSLAELEIGQSTIDVLEGTREAFASRSIKYTDVVGKPS